MQVTEVASVSPGRMFGNGVAHVLVGLTWAIGPILGFREHASGGMGDLRPEIVFARYGSYQNPAEDAVLRGNPGGRFAQVVGAIAEPGGAVRSERVGAADFDVDGDLDLFVLGAVNAQSYVGDNRGNLSFRGSTLTSARLVNWIDGNTCALEDVDGDGDIDVFTGGFAAQLLLDTVR